MWPYFFVATVLLFLGFFEVLIGQRKVSKYVAIISVAILVIFAGLKEGGVTDYNEYKYIYETFDASTSGEFIEPGYTLFMYLCNTIGCGFILFYFLVACVSISTKGCVIYKILPIVSAAFLVYFCGCFFERDNDGIRQGLSIAFCFIALLHLSKNENKKYLLFTLIAASIHYSSIVFFLAWFIQKLKCSNRAVTIFISVSYIIAITGHYITPYLLKILPVGMAATKIDIYSTMSSYSSELGITIGLLFRTFLLFLFMANRKRMPINNELYYLFRNGLAIAIICSLLFGDFIIIAHRLPYVFREFQIFIVSFLVSSLPGKGARLIGLGVVYIYTIIILSRYFTDGAVYNDYNNLLF